MGVVIKFPDFFWPNVEMSVLTVRFVDLTVANTLFTSDGHYILACFVTTNLLFNFYAI